MKLNGIGTKPWLLCGTFRSEEKTRRNNKLTCLPASESPQCVISMIRCIDSGEQDCIYSLQATSEKQPKDSVLSPLTLIERHDHSIDRQNIPWCAMQLTDRHVSFRPKNILHLHRFNDTQRLACLDRLPLLHRN